VGRARVKACIGWFPGRHAPPPGLAFGEPDDRLQRGIQHAAASRFGTMANAFCSNKRRWLWVPAFAGTTHSVAHSLHKELSSSGLTGGSSTPWPLDSIIGVSGILDPRFRGDD